MTGTIGRLAPSIALILQLALAPQLAAQLTIRPYDHKTAMVTGGVGLVVPIRCDDSGAAYFREYIQGRGITTLSKLAADAQSYVHFEPSPSARDGIQNPQFSDFAVEHDGSVLELGVDPATRLPFILRFDRDGSYQGSISLDTQMFAFRLAPLGRSGFLVTGALAPKPGEEPAQPKVTEPFIALFDRNGRFVKKVSLAPKASAGIKPGSTLVKSPDRPVAVDPEAIGITASDQGVAYLLNREKLLVTVISAAGEIDRQFSIVAPEGMSPISVRANGGALLVEFNKQSDGHNTDVVLGLYSALDGEQTALYTVAPEIPAAFACYDFKGTFSFLSLDEKGYRSLILGNPH